MPQLGETVTEGTITRWFKQVGESVAADEPLFEVSTDKVDSEVPAPAAGVVSEILVAEGDTTGALAEYQKALTANPNSSLASYRIGEVLFNQKNYQAAANAYRDALRGDALRGDAP